MATSAVLGLGPLGTADNLLLITTYGTSSGHTPITVSGCQSTCNCLGLLPTAQTKLFRNTVITERLRPAHGYEGGYTFGDFHYGPMLSGKHTGEVKALRGMSTH